MTLIQASKAAYSALVKHGEQDVAFNLMAAIEATEGSDDLARPVREEGGAVPTHAAPPSSESPVIDDGTCYRPPLALDDPCLCGQKHCGLVHEAGL